MRTFHPWLIVLALVAISTNVEAQIYTCKGKDGTRIFSDEKCGPDAKVVPNIMIAASKVALIVFFIFLLLKFLYSVLPPLGP